LALSFQSQLSQFVTKRKKIFSRIKKTVGLQKRIKGLWSGPACYLLMGKVYQELGKLAKNSDPTNMR
jgi:hypothetical protein